MGESFGKVIFAKFGVDDNSFRLGLKIAEAVRSAIEKVFLEIHGRLEPEDIDCKNLFQRKGNPPK
jgi:hypothetical protein